MQSCFILSFLLINLCYDKRKLFLICDKVTFKDPEAAMRACQNPSPVIDGRRANCNLASLGAHKTRPPTPQHGYHLSCFFFSTIFWILGLVEFCHGYWLHIYLVMDHKTWENGNVGYLISISLKIPWFFKNILFWKCIYRW